MFTDRTQKFEFYLPLFSDFHIPQKELISFPYT
jgi:hypothetical protein